MAKRQDSSKENKLADKQGTIGKASTKSHITKDKVQNIFLGTI